MSISQSELKKYVDAFIIFEKQAHGINPRDTLEGTALRLKNYEGYKFNVYEKCRDLLKAESSYTDAIIKALPGENLVSSYYRGKLKRKLDEVGRDRFEDALKLLYEKDEDEQAFNAICDIVGNEFAFLGFIFFLKDKTKYMPISSGNFDKKFKLIGLDAGLAGNCTWDKYQQYNEWIEEVQDYLVSNLNDKVTLLDAHSFLWMLNSEGVDLEGIVLSGFNEADDDQLVSNINGPVDWDKTKDFEYEAKALKKPKPTFRNGNKTYPRDKQVAMNAIAHADFRCEMDKSHRTFIRKRTDKPYTEPHHLIPIAYTDRFDVSLDREQNIVSLCSNCHNEIHYGKDAKRLIVKLYEQRKKLLKDIGVEITLDELLEMYGIKSED